MEERVILVTEEDRETGTAEKMEAHRQGLLHRAFSVFVRNSDGLLLLQRRAFEKYHSGGLWANTCCSHPRQGESVLEAGHRRLMEEMGFDCPLEEIHSFIYRADLDNGLIEHEYDHVLTGIFDGEPQPESSEVCEYKWISIDDLLDDIKLHPEAYTYWFKTVIDTVAELFDPPSHQ